MHNSGCSGKPHRTSKNRSKRVLFRKKKRHTLKTQVIIEEKTREIIDVVQAKGSVHDFKIYKDSIGKIVDELIKILTDLGYLGIDKLHLNSLIPIKESKNHKLTKKEKMFNKKLAQRRVIIEHINAKIKTFKITAYPYR
ncbi:MAG: transposase, partial [Firmicutes bacterium]|nr:transposase [Bacillota bacterium]